MAELGGRGAFTGAGIGAVHRRVAAIDRPPAPVR